MKRAEDIRMCIGYGTDTIGIVVEYPEPVPWNVDAATAKELIAACETTAKSCIVTHGDITKYVQLAYTLQPDYMQIHFGGDVEDIFQLTKQLGSCSKTRLIVTFTPTTPFEEIMELSKLDISALLHDLRVPGNSAREH